jgi:hypothetical protein
MFEDREERFAHVFTKLRGLGLTEYEKAHRGRGQHSSLGIQWRYNLKIFRKFESMGTSMHYFAKKMGIYEHDKLRQIACCWKVPQIGHATIFRTFITKYWDVRLLPNNSMRYACVKMWFILLWFVMYLYIYASATSLWINKPMRCSQDPFFGRRIMNIIGISSPSLFFTHYLRLAML